MATEPGIDYEVLQQQAMRGVVRAVLQQTVKTGLPGEHHFYISFLTHAPGVILSKRLKEKYPQEMTIVLQHRFWDLIVSEDRFEVKLTFDSIPERLVVPYAAIKVFIDPSVRFGLQFDDAAGTQDTAAPRRPLTMDATLEQVGEAQAENSRSATAKKTRSARKAKSEKDGGPAKPPRSIVQPVPMPETVSSRSTDDAPQADNETPPAPSTAKILSLDQFRKK